MVECAKENECNFHNNLWTYRNSASWYFVPPAVPPPVLPSEGKLRIQSGPKFIESVILKKLSFITNRYQLKSTINLNSSKRHWEGMYIKMEVTIFRNRKLLWTFIISNKKCYQIFSRLFYWRLFHWMIQKSRRENNKAPGFRLGGTRVTIFVIFIRGSTAWKFIWISINCRMLNCKQILRLTILLLPENLFLHSIKCNKWLQQNCRLSRMCPHETDDIDNIGKRNP